MQWRSVRVTGIERWWDVGKEKQEELETEREISPLEKLAPNVFEILYTLVHCIFTYLPTYLPT